MKEKRLLQRLWKAVVSAASHKGTACATRETRVHRAPQADGNCKWACTCALICAATQGGSRWVKPDLMTTKGSFTKCGNTRLLTPSATHSTGLPSSDIKYSLSQLPQTNGCSSVHGDAESKEYPNNDLLQKYPRVLASWCAQPCTLTDTWKHPRRQTASQAADGLR